MKKPGIFRESLGIYFQHFALFFSMNALVLLPFLLLYYGSACQAKTTVTHQIIPNKWSILATGIILCIENIFSYFLIKITWNISAKQPVFSLNLSNRTQTARNMGYNFIISAGILGILCILFSKNLKNLDEPFVLFRIVMLSFSSFIISSIFRIRNFQLHEAPLQKPSSRVIISENNLLRMSPVLTIPTALTVLIICALFFPHLWNFPYNQYVKIGLGFFLIQILSITLIAQTLFYRKRISVDLEKWTKPIVPPLKKEPSKRKREINKREQIHTYPIFTLSTEYYFKKILLILSFNTIFIYLVYYLYSWIASTNNPFGDAILMISLAVPILYLFLSSILVLSCIDNRINIPKNIDCMLSTLKISFMIMLLIPAGFMTGPGIFLWPFLIYELIMPFMQVYFLILDRDLDEKDAKKISNIINALVEHNKPRIFGLSILSTISWISVFCLILTIIGILFWLFNNPFSGQMKIHLNILSFIIAFMVGSYLLMIQATLYRVKSSYFFDDMKAPDEIEDWGEKT